MATVGQNIGQTLEEQNLEFYCDFIDRKNNEIRKKIEENLKEQLAQVDPATFNYQLFEVIKAVIRPDFRELVYKEYFNLKLRYRATLGWNKVHKQILKLPFCHNRQQIVRMIICFETNCLYEGCCFPCYKEGKKLHKVSISPPIESIPDFPTIEYDPFLEICSRDCDWHEWHHYFYNCLSPLQAASYYSR